MSDGMRPEPGNETVPYTPALNENTGENAGRNVQGGVRISVITPVFNGERYIETCIQNVISQNDPHAEHIIVDGGSSDGTVEIIKKYAESHPHIRWASEHDRGQADAMNHGLALAKGSIVSFLNVDDYYEPGTLLRVGKIIKTLPEPAFLAGNCNIWDEKNQLLAVNKPRRLHFRDLLIGNGIFVFPVNPSAYFYHKSLHDRVGLYDVMDNYSMDLDFILRAVQVANVKYVDEVFGNFRLIPGTKTYEDQKEQGGARAEMVFRKYEIRLGFSEKIILTCMRAFYVPLFFIFRIIRGRYYDMSEKRKS